MGRPLSARLSFRSPAEQGEVRSMLLDERGASRRPPRRASIRWTGRRDQVIQAIFWQSSRENVLSKGTGREMFARQGVRLPGQVARRMEKQQVLADRRIIRGKAREDCGDGGDEVGWEFEMEQLAQMGDGELILLEVESNPIGRVGASSGAKPAVVHRWRRRVWFSRRLKTVSEGAGCRPSGASSGASSKTRHFTLRCFV